MAAHTQKDNGYYLDEPYSIPAAYYPGTGYTEGRATLYNVGKSTFSWSATMYDARASYALYIYNSNYSSTYSSYSWYEHTIRCTKVDTSGKPGSGDDYIVDDEYEW